MLAATPPPVQIQKKRGLGCLGCGCSIFAVLLLLVAGLLAAGAWYGYHALRDYTGVSSVAVPQFDGGDQVFASAQKNLTSFRQQLESGQPASLHLNADQINTLILHDPSFAQFQGHVFIAIKGDEATLQTSVPLKSFETAIFPDRFLNGDASFGLGFDAFDKSIDFDLHALHVTGHDLPAGFEDGFNRTFNQVLNQKLQTNPAIHAFLERTKKISIENGELVIETQ